MCRATGDHRTVPQEVRSGIEEEQGLGRSDRQDGRKEEIAAHGLSRGNREISAYATLHHVAAAHITGGTSIFHVFRYRQEHDPCCAEILLHSSRRLEPVFSRHSNVYYDNVWLKHRHGIETRLAITHGSHNLKFVFHNLACSHEHFGVIVDQNNLRFFLPRCCHFLSRLKDDLAFVVCPFSLRELPPYERHQVRYPGRLSRLLPVSCLSFARRLLR